MKKVVIYTAISGAYDNLYKIPNKLRKYKFICFSDTYSGNINGWEVTAFPNEGLDNVRKCRDVKIRPQIYLKDYDISVWVDANIAFKVTLIDEIEAFIKSRDLIKVFEHPSRDCIYSEADFCIKKGKDAPSIIKKQMNFYSSISYPENNGLIESNVIIRNHNNPLIIKCMNDWWSMVSNYSRRDQLSFNYCVWLNQLSYSKFNGNSRFGNSTFRIRPHRKKATIYYREKIMIFLNRIFKRT